MVAAVSIFDSVFRPRQSALCDQMKGRARLVFPFRSQQRSSLTADYADFTDQMRRKRETILSDLFPFMAGCGWDCRLYTDWRSQFHRVKSADVFGNDRVARSHH